MKIKHLVLLICLIIMISACSDNTQELPDVKGMEYHDGYWYKTPKELDGKSVFRYADVIYKIYDMYLNENMNVYYTIVPDKSLYIETNRYESYYNNMLEILNDNVKTAKFIEISDTLKIDDYYKTDDHWRQECLELTVNRLGEYMDFNIDFDKFIYNEYNEFIGMYRLQIENLESEKLIYLTSEYIDKAVMDNMQYPAITSVYDMSKLETDVMYDMFLSGVTPIVTITNEIADITRELIIFRDSFASSLTPLLLQAYSKITLIDSRFILMDLIGDYVEFNNQDVLFMHCDLIINNSLLLK